MENKENVVNEEIKNQSKPEWQEKMETMIHEAYLTGLSKGGKTFVGLIYEIVLESHKKKLNPAKTVLKIETACKRMLGLEDSEPVEKEKRRKE